MLKFVLVCHGRTGSTLLVETFDQHPAVRMFGEIFTLDENDRRALYDVDGRAWAGEDAAEFVRDAVFVPRAGVESVGFKYMFHHRLDPRAAVALDYLASMPEVRAILLNREDLFACLVSRECAMRSELWQIRDAEPLALANYPRFRIEKAHCTRYFELIARQRDEIENLFAGHRVLELEYARDIEQNFDRTIRGIQEFLEVEIRPLAPALRKLPPRSVREQVENFDELAAHFATTAYAPWFECG